MDEQPPSSGSRASQEPAYKQRRMVMVAMPADTLQALDAAVTTCQSHRSTLIREITVGWLTEHGYFSTDTVTADTPVSLPQRPEVTRYRTLSRRYRSPMRLTTFSIPANFVEAMERVARGRGMTRSELGREMIEAGLRAAGALPSDVE